MVVAATKVVTAIKVAAMLVVVGWGLGAGRIRARSDRQTTTRDRINHLRAYSLASRACMNHRT